MLACPEQISEGEVTVMLTKLPTPQQLCISEKGYLAAGLLDKGNGDEGCSDVDDPGNHGCQQGAALGVDCLEDDGRVEHHAVDARPLLEARHQRGDNLWEDTQCG